MMPNSFAELIGLWPSKSEFARDIHVNPTHVGTMLVRGSIPPKHWTRVVDAAKKRDLPEVTTDLLSCLYRQRFQKSEAA